MLFTIYVIEDQYICPNVVLVHSTNDQEVWLYVMNDSTMILC